MWSTGVGSHPGTDARDYAEAVRIVLGEVPILPYLPELPGRGPHGSITGRGCAVLSELGVDLQPAGWRLTKSSGIDHRRTRSLLAQDLDQVEEQAHGYTGWFKVQIAGPWTLAATVEKPRGDKVVADHGARRELAESLAEGLAHHVVDVKRRLAGVNRLVVQLDEPILPAVLNGRVSTASGFGKHRSVAMPEISAALELVCGALVRVGAEPWVHCCASGFPYGVLAAAGVRGYLVDVSLLSPYDHDQLGEFLDDGGVVGLGLLPGRPPLDTPSDASVTSAGLRWLEMLGLDPTEVPDQVGVTTSCGFAGAQQNSAWPRQALALAKTAAENLMR
jgi:methionine synthase II (cobalamin-independent)